MTHAEQDLFRAAVVFAGAGVDTALKEALRSCVPIRIRQSDTARGKYIEFVTRNIQDGAGVSARRLAELLTTGRPEDVLLDAYIQSLTGSSLQSREQVKNSLTALGLTDKGLYTDAVTLDPLFKARNEIAHEMDMTPTALQRTQGARTRRERSLKVYEDMCHAGLNYCQRVLTPNRYSSPMTRGRRNVFGEWSFWNGDRVTEPLPLPPLRGQGAVLRCHEYAILAPSQQVRPGHAGLATPPQRGGRQHGDVTVV